MAALMYGSASQCYLCRGSHPDAGTCIPSNLLHFGSPLLFLLCCSNTPNRWRNRTLALQITESTGLTWIRYFGKITPMTVLGGKRNHIDLYGTVTGKRPGPVKDNTHNRRERSCRHVTMYICIYVRVYMYRISNVWSSYPWSSNSIRLEAFHECSTGMVTFTAVLNDGW